MGGVEMAERLATSALRRYPSRVGANAFKPEKTEQI